MENLGEKTNRKAGWRRAKRHVRDRKFVSLPAEGKAWAVIAVGALILALVAFVSGAKMGKALSDLKNPLGVPFPQTKGPKEILSRLGISGGERHSRQGTKGLPSEVPAEQTEKNAEPARSKEMGLTRESKPAEEATPKPGEAKAVSPSKPRFTLQIAALNSSEEARELVNKLRGKGYPAYQVTGSAAAKGTLYWVRLGQFQSLQEARQSALEFEKKEKTKTIITPWQ